jgi:fatty-acyl-CoA synthase
MNGYFDRADGLDADGWWHSGDIGTLTTGGYLKIVGRKKDMYIRGGFNIYPAEIEAVLGQHHKVSLCAVTSFADPVLGERGRAYVVCEGSEVTELELQNFCRQRIADYKVPDEVVFVAELPLAGPGKVDRSALRRLADCVGTA